MWEPRMWEPPMWEPPMWEPNAALGERDGMHEEVWHEGGLTVSTIDLNTPVACSIQQACLGQTVFTT